jgi:hypothetical protein
MRINPKLRIYGLSINILSLSNYNQQFKNIFTKSNGNIILHLKIYYFGKIIKYES